MTNDKDTANSVNKKQILDAVMRKIDAKNNPDIQPITKMQISTHRDLLEESTNIGDLKRYNMLLQNISISPEVNDYLRNSHIKDEGS